MCSPAASRAIYTLLNHVGDQVGHRPGDGFAAASVHGSLRATTDSVHAGVGSTIGIATISFRAISSRNAKCGMIVMKSLRQTIFAIAERLSQSCALTLMS